jgi:phage repressor protein C with HTH and peptisase S24 domain
MAADEPITVTINGDCMQPLLHPGAQIEVCSARRYLPGDIVVLLAPDGHYLVHRVLGVYRRKGHRKLLTQADAATRPDRADSPDRVIGRVCGGECDPRVMEIPLVHRLQAIVCFTRHALRKLLSVNKLSE